MGPLWQDLGDAHLFITGGTGFFGRWLVESLLRATDGLGLGLRLTLLTRRPREFAAAAPLVAAHPAVILHEGDMASFSFPGQAATHVIHSATDTGRTGTVPQAEADTIIAGTRRVLEYAARSQSRRLLYVSSGAVYGGLRGPVAEGQAASPEALSGYGAGKRASEQLCAQADLAHSVARCFSFIGPLLPLDGPYAAGNFLRDALAGGPILVRGDGTPLRSYLYAADLAIWLWTILLRGANGQAYNVGSAKAVSVAELAHRVAAGLAPSPRVIVQGQASQTDAGSAYLPCIDQAVDELGLFQYTCLEEALARTLLWYR